jgi:NAD(P)-dependent dehydrogenase (short-subunit alcohol dehydrogenase family)
MSGNLEGKVALVTGASGGIGAETARELARRSAAVAVVARREPESLDVVRDIEESGGKAIFVKADVAVPDDVYSMIETVVRWGGRLDIAVNNAALVGDVTKSVADVAVEDWHRVMDVNLNGLFHCMRAEIRAMREAGGGSIVNVLSTAAVKAERAGSAYVASKHAGLGLTCAAAQEEIGNGIRVNALCPGGTFTAMASEIKEQNPGLYAALVAKYPIGRLATPSEQASAIAFLCGPDAAFIVGSALTVDGGYLLT